MWFMTGREKRKETFEWTNSGKKGLRNYRLSAATQKVLVYRGKREE